MISLKEIEENLPFPIKIVLYCDYDDCDDFLMLCSDSIKNLLNGHNRKYDTKIDSVKVHCAMDYESSDDENLLEKKGYHICVGNEVVHSMDCTESEYYKSVLENLKPILSIWHEKIIEVQKSNELKIQQYEDEDYHEMLYGYYSMNDNKKAFLYLKKLASRYPHSKYRNKSQKIYRFGLYGWHKRSPASSLKIKTLF